MTKVLYDPAKHDFVRGADGKPVLTEKTSPTRDDAAAAIAAHHANLSTDLKARAPDAPPGTHWCELEETVWDVGQGSFMGPNNVPGEPIIELLSSGKALRKIPILRK